MDNEQSILIETPEQAHQRRFLRYPAATPLRCLRRHDEFQLECELRNIGSGGLAFVSSEPLQPGDVLEVSFLLPDEEPALVGEVVWSAPLEETTGSHTQINGLEFLVDPACFHASLIEQVRQIEAYRAAQQGLGREITAQRASEEWWAKHAEA